jgi:hypothetical protein
LRQALASVFQQAQTRGWVTGAHDLCAKQDWRFPVTALLRRGLGAPEGGVDVTSIERNLRDHEIGFGHRSVWRGEARHHRQCGSAIAGASQHRADL